MKKRVSVCRGISPFIFCLFAFSAVAESQENRELGNCDATATGNTLIVLGNDIANAIDVVSSERGIQVICDGVSEVFNGIEEVIIQARDGDDIATFDHIGGSTLAVLTMKMGEGNDQANVSQILGMALNILGEGGDDAITLTEVLLDILPVAQATVVDLGGGQDEVLVGTIPLSAIYEIVGILDQGVPDPQIRVIDAATGQLFADLRVQQTEEIAIQSSRGDDTFNVSWIAGRMSGLTLLTVDLGDGEDTFNVTFFPPPDDGLPVPLEIQTANLELTAVGKDDQLNFTHAAGSWFDVNLTAKMGIGNDDVDILLGPPPDDSLPGPTGIRNLQFDVVSGKGDDFVTVQNQTNGEFFDVFFKANFNNGNDTFEGTGEIRAAELLPGNGFDVAHVTPNFRPFVTRFEEVTIVE